MLAFIEAPIYSEKIPTALVFCITASTIAVGLSYPNIFASLLLLFFISKRESFAMFSTFCKLLPVYELKSKSSFIDSTLFPICSIISVLKEFPTPIKFLAIVKGKDITVFTKLKNIDMLVANTLYATLKTFITIEPTIERPFRIWPNTGIANTSLPIPFKKSEAFSLNFSYAFFAKSLIDLNKLAP